MSKGHVSRGAVGGAPGVERSRLETHHMPTILPVMSCAWDERKTAMHTIQLHMMPLTKVWPNVAATFFCATLAARRPQPVLEA